MSRRNYSGSAQATTLPVPIGSGDTSFAIASGTNLPTSNFVLTIDTGGVEEKVLVGTRTGTALSSVTRGFDGTTAQPHVAGVSVRHTISAVDLDEANAHVNSAANVHGIASVDGNGTVVSGKGGYVYRFNRSLIANGSFNGTTNNFYVQLPGPLFSGPQQHILFTASRDLAVGQRFYPVQGYYLQDPASQTGMNVFLVNDDGNLAATQTIRVSVVVPYSTVA